VVKRSILDSKRLHRTLRLRVVVLIERIGVALPSLIVGVGVGIICGEVLKLCRALACSMVE